MAVSSSTPSASRLGKLPEQRVLLIGTRAPSPDDGWWPELLDAGSGDGIHVTDLHAGPELAWDSWEAICAANPIGAHRGHDPPADPSGAR